MEVTVAAGSTSSEIQGYVTSALDTLGINSGTYSHVLYVMPAGVSLNGAAAFAYVGWYLSVFANTYARTLLVLMHELGHNLRMLHSGKDGASCKFDE